MVTVDLVDTRPSTVDLANRPHTPELTSLPLTEHPLANAVRAFLSSDQFLASPLNTRLAYGRNLGRLTERFTDHPTIPSAADIETYLGQLDQLDYSPSTIRQHYAAILSCYEWCSDEKQKLLPPLRIPQVAKTWRQQPNPGPTLTDEQALALLWEADHNEKDRDGRDSALLTVGLRTGATVSEVVALTTAYVRPQENGISLVLSRENRSRVAFVADQPSIDRIAAYREKRNPKDQQNPNAPFFKAKNLRTDDPISRQGVWLMLKGYGNRLSIDLTPHMLRRYHLAHKD